MNISPSLGPYIQVEESNAKLPKLEITNTDSTEGRECLMRLPSSYDGSIPDSFLARAGQKIGGETTIIWISNLLVHMGRFYGSGIEDNYELCRPTKPFRLNYNFRKEHSIRDAVVKNRAFIMTPFDISFNFYHFLIDAIPRFQYRELFARFSSPFLISPTRAGFQPNVMNLILKKRYPIYETAKPILLRECAVTSHVSRPAAVDFLRDRSKKVIRNNEHKRIYISRRNSLFRRVINESDLEPVLAKFGFVIVDCENLRFDEQVSLFKGAEIVCGPHGAGLTNIVFCQKETSVLEIVMEERTALSLGSVFWELACAADLKYHILSSARIPVDDKHDYDDAMYVDPQKLELALEQVMSSRKRII